MTRTTATLPPGARSTASAPLPLSIRLLRRLNPLIASLLRSPLHGVLSRNLLLLTYTGRKTGRPRTLPLSYVELGASVYLCTRSSLWWRSLRDGARVELRLRGSRIGAAASVVDPHSVEALDALRAFLGNNPRTGEVLYDVRRGPDGRPLEEDLAREVLRSVVVRLERATAPLP